MLGLFFFFFFFKQKTAYEMRISDWSSDVCSSDLWTTRYPAIARALAGLDLDGALLDGEIVVVDEKGRSDFGALQRALKGEDSKGEGGKIGRASCRERVCQYV